MRREMFTRFQREGKIERALERQRAKIALQPTMEIGAIFRGTILEERWRKPLHGERLESRRVTVDRGDRVLNELANLRRRPGADNFLRR